jgi:hypothetical protein
MQGLIASQKITRIALTFFCHSSLGGFGQPEGVPGIIVGIGAQGVRVAGRDVQRLLRRRRPLHI